MSEAVATEIIGPQITIRELTPEDVGDWEKFKKIRLEALEAEPLAFADDSARAKKNYNDEVWQEKMTSNQRRWMIAEDGDKNFVGIVGAVVNDPELGEGVARLTNVYVNADHRKEGLGRKLVTQMIDVLYKDASIHEVRLEVTSSQEAAFNLYRSLGFQHVDTIKDAVHDGEKTYDEYLMQRQMRE